MSQIVSGINIGNLISNLKDSESMSGKTALFDDPLKYGHGVDRVNLTEDVQTSSLLAGQSGCCCMGNPLANPLP